MPRVTYNERSWAIDVISEINSFLNQRSWHLKSAGGEVTVSDNQSRLFPDVLIYKDQGGNIILQGWELKMPDTAINNAELIHNAKKKAEILQRDSFLLWNVRDAVLYVKEENDFGILKSWDSIDVNTRAEVKPKEALWKALLFEILEDLNNFFESGQINETATTEILSIEAVIDVVLENTDNTVEEIRRKVRASSRLEAEINNWWSSSFGEYGYKTAQSPEKFPTLSRVVLTDWVFKIVFSHILKRHFNEARRIEEVIVETSINEAIDIIKSISENCNFWNILNPNLAQNHISGAAWNQIVELNQFLSNSNIDDIEIEILHELLQSSVASAKRKVAGQFSTPKKIADLLTRLTIDDKTKIVLDPCCGTGTIIKQAYQLKEEYELSQHEILSSIWASDKHSFPIQLSTLSMASPSNMGEIVNVFSSDVIDLAEGSSVEFRNPNDGALVEKIFPKIDYVVSNLPFIKSKEIKILNPDIVDINEWIQEKTGSDESLSGKSDIFAYIPFYLHRILSDSGRIGLILSNAWMGTEYGEIFLRLFKYFFKIEYVVISGKGKWFNNAKVVTTILVASKIDPIEEINENSEILFCTLKEDIAEIGDVKSLSEDIILGNETEQVLINKYSKSQIEVFQNFGIPWSGYFSNLSWIENVSNKFIDANEIFHFIRGERRGWNGMFYPAEGHNIEPEYTKPVLKHLRDTKGLNSAPNKEAFCCSKSIEELTALDHTGALNWIRSFENQTNGNNILLPEVLAKPNMFWYEMTTQNMADFIANVNYHESLFIARLENRSFIDQRMIGFSVREEYQGESKILYLALLNSVANMFLIESFGFGRGEGALDLRAKKFKEDFKILSPHILSEEQKTSIIRAFNPLIMRDRLPLKEEIEAPDRIDFESALMEIYGISEYYEQIKEALLRLYRIRFAVKG